MAVDASIPLQVRPVAIPDPIESYGKALTLRNLVTQGQLGDIQLRQAQQNQQDEDALRELAPQAGGDMTKLRDLVYNRGLFKQGLALDKQVLDQRAKEAEIKKNLAQADSSALTTASTKFKALNQAGSAAMQAYQDALAKGLPEPMARAVAQPAYEAGVSQLIQSGIIGKDQLSTIPQTFDPVHVKAALDQSLSWDKMLEYELNKRNTESQIANRDLVPNGQGGYGVNQPLVGAKGAVAAAGASRNITNVNAYTPASEAAQKDFMEKVSKRHDALQSAPVVLQNINAAKAQIPQAATFMGPGGQPMLEATKFLNNRLGMNISTEGVKSAEELRTRLFSQIMENLKKMDASPSEYQQKMMQDALGSLNTDPKALPRVLDVFADIVKGKVSLHNQEVQSAIDRGVKFPYDPKIDIGSSKSDTSPSQAPVRIKGDDGYNALPSGSLFIGPDGVTRRKP